MIKGKKIIQCGLCGRWFRKSRAYTLIKEGRRPQKIRVCADCYQLCGYVQRRKLDNPEIKDLEKQVAEGKLLKCPEE